MNVIRSHTCQSAGFSLVEVALALGVAGFCLVAIFGLLPIGVNSNQSSIEQTHANGILSEVTADLRATPGPGTATSQQFGIQIPAPSTTTSGTTLFFSNDGQFSTSLNGPLLSGSATQSRERLTVTFLPNAQAQTSGTSARTATLVNLKVTWPAGANLASPAGSVQTFVALDRN